MSKFFSRPLCGPRNLEISTFQRLHRCDKSAAMWPWLDQMSRWAAFAEQMGRLRSICGGRKGGQRFCIGPVHKAIRSRSKCQENHKNFKVTVKLLKPGQSACRVTPRVIEKITFQLLELRIIYHFQDIGHHVTPDFFAFTRVGRVIVHRLINPL